MTAGGHRELGALMDDADLAGGYLCAEHYELFDATSTPFLFFSILFFKNAFSRLDE